MTSGGVGGGVVSRLFDLFRLSYHHGALHSAAWLAGEPCPLCEELAKANVAAMRVAIEEGVRDGLRAAGFEPGSEDPSR